MTPVRPSGGAKMERGEAAVVVRARQSRGGSERRRGAAVSGQGAAATEWGGGSGGEVEGGGEGRGQGGKRPGSEGFKSRAQAVLAAEDAIKKHPGLIVGLVGATLRGMQERMKEPKAAAAAYVEAVPSYQGKEAQIERTFNLYNQYVYAGQKVLGHIDEKRLDAVQKFYVSEGIVPKAEPLADLYTNQFIGTAR